MTWHLRHFAQALAALGLLTAPGCERLFDKGSKDDIATAEKKAAAGDFNAAVQFYEASLDGTAKSAETHYKLALLYADKLKSPLDAVHHLDRYLALAPNGAHAKYAQNLRKEDEGRLHEKLTNSTSGTQDETVRLRNQVNALVAQLAELRAQQKQQATATNTTHGPHEKIPIPPGARSYTVRPGDTFAKISRQFYKTSSRARKIQDANFTQATGTVTIKPGMVLFIPK